MGYDPRSPRNQGSTPQPEVLVRSLLVALGLAVLLVAGALGSFACFGGGDDDEGETDVASIPTATPPEVLPEVVIVTQGDSPASGGNGDDETYVVQDGDTLSSIAELYGITVEELLEANGLTADASLSIGQELIIPGQAAVLGSTDTPDVTDTPVPADEPLPTDTPPVDEPPTDGDCTGHVVQDGEFPDNIAPIYGLTTEELMAANPGIDPSALQVGDCLALP